MSEGDCVSRYPKQLLSALSTIVYEITPKLYRVVCVGLFISNLANFAIAKMCNLSCFVVIDNILGKSQEIVIVDRTHISAVSMLSTN